MKDSIILEARELAFMDRVRPRSSKIWHLSDELFTEAVKAYYVARVSFAKIRERLAEAGVCQRDLPSQAAWVKFWSTFKPFLRLARRRAATEGANACAAEARRSPTEFDEAILDLVRQLAFELVDSDEADPKEVSLLVRLLLKHRDQKLKERLVEVAEQRVALAQERRAGARTTTRGTVNDGGVLSEEERERRIREIFGIGGWEAVRPASSEAGARRHTDLKIEGAQEQAGALSTVDEGSGRAWTKDDKTPGNTLKHPEESSCTAHQY